MTPRIDGIDHIHVFVSDRAAAERWYAEVLGFSRVAALEFWATGGGPLTLQDESRRVHLALFERASQACRSTIALRVSALAFLAWRRHLRASLPEEPRLEDHAVSWSLYFSDADGNPFEITSYDYEDLAGSLSTR